MEKTGVATPHASAAQSTIRAFAFIEFPSLGCPCKLKLLRTDTAINAQVFAKDLRRANILQLSTATTKVAKRG
jgi:hypothetical protein